MPTWWEQETGDSPVSGGDAEVNYIPTIDVTSVRPSSNAPIGEPGSEWTATKVNPDQLRKKLKAKGYPDAAIDGIIANFESESGGNPDAVGDEGTSFGLGQWHNSRWDDLKAFAKKEGKDPSDPDVQIDFMDQELRDKYPKLRESLMASKDPEAAEESFKRLYERPASVLWANNAQGGPVLGTGKYQFSDDALSQAAGTPDTSLIFMPPQDYLDLSPPLPEGQSRQRSLLEKSLAAGEPVHTLPSLDASMEGTSGTVTDQDGRNRAQLAQENGLDLIPVVLKGAPQGSPVTELQGMTGNVVPIMQGAPPGLPQPQRRPMPGVLDWLAPSAAAATLTKPTADQATRATNAQTAQANEWGDQPVEAEQSPPEAQGAGDQLAAGGAPSAQATAFDRFLSGLRDPIEGGAQLLSHLVPAPVEQAIDQANNWLSAHTGLVAPLPPGGMDEEVRDREAALQAARGGDTGFDWWRAAGNIASPVNYLPIMRGLGAASGLARMGMAAGGGAIAAALNPVTEHDYWWAKAGDTAEGALTGGALGAAGEGFARTVAPHFRHPAQLLLDEGVSLTPGQMAGGVAKQTEDAMASVPLLGHAIQAGQRRSVETFNRAAINRALAPIAQRLPRGINAGHDAIAYAGSKLDQAYDALLPKLRAAIDPTFRQELGVVAQLGSNLPAQQKMQLFSIIKNEILDRFTQHGVASGFTAKEIESKLGGMSAMMFRSADYDVRRLGGAVKELQASVRRMVARVNPQERGALQAINRGWANLLRVQRAASNVGARDGVFTPSQLLRAVRALDPSKGKAAFARGHALMQDLADAGQAVLPSSIPDSGTPTRLLWAGLAGGAHFAPEAAIPGMAAASLYTSPGMALLRQFATVAPKTRNMLAALPRVGSVLGAPTASILATSQRGAAGAPTAWGDVPAP